jgi:hypothetical protein
MERKRKDATSPSLSRKRLRRNRRDPARLRLSPRLRPIKEEPADQDQAELYRALGLDSPVLPKDQEQAEEPLVSREPRLLFGPGGTFGLDDFASELLLMIAHCVWMRSPPSLARLAKASTRCRAIVLEYVRHPRWTQHPAYQADPVRRITFKFCFGHIMVTDTADRPYGPLAFVTHTPHVSVYRDERLTTSIAYLEFTCLDGPHTGATYRVRIKHNDHAYQISLLGPNGLNHTIAAIREHDKIFGDIDKYAGLLPLRWRDPMGSGSLWLPRPVLPTPPDDPDQAELNKHILIIYRHLALRCWPYQQLAFTARVWAGLLELHRQETEPNQALS